MHSKVLHPSCSHTTIYITLYSLIGPSNPSFPARPRTCRLQHQLCAMVQLHENGKRVQRSRTDCLFEIRPLCLFPSEPPLLHAHQNRQPCTILMLPFEPRHTHDYLYCAIQSQSLWHMGTLSPRLSLDFFFSLKRPITYLINTHPLPPSITHRPQERERYEIGHSYKSRYPDNEDWRTPDDPKTGQPLAPRSVLSDDNSCKTLLSKATRTTKT